MKLLKEFVDVLGGPLEAVGALVICIGTWVALILTSAIWG